ncbi:hypothetical protein C8Q80DRAFT_290648 [Daedaleopsis nitida]|nr:hypothetical protein C8Q80DRAFT_290648 [Daedaleopsis nitida]
MMFPPCQPSSTVRHAGLRRVSGIDVDIRPGVASFNPHRRPSPEVCSSEDARSPTHVVLRCF